MLKTHLRVALRHLRRQRGFAALNVAGLAIGLACCLLIGLYVRAELAHDRHHAAADRIYRVTERNLQAGEHWAPVGPAVGPAVADAVAGVGAVARFVSVGDAVVLEANGHQAREDGLLYADAAALDVFTLPLLRGDARTALAEPNTVVLTESLAGRYFGAADPLGHVVTLDGELSLRVTGVMVDPGPSHLPFEALVSMPTFYNVNGEWVREARTWKAAYTYALLGEGVDAGTVQAGLHPFSEGFFDAEDERQLVLQPLTEIHLHSRLEKEWRPNGDITYVYLFGAVALFVLLIAGINFTNLATARSAERAKEVGVRKTLGARRGGLVAQFLAEAVLLALTAAGAALLLAQGALPFFRTLSGKDLGGVLTDPFGIAATLGMGLVVGLLAGAYPALVLSGFQPARVLRGRFASSSGGARLRKGLVVFQFGLSVALLAGTAVVYRQVDFLTSRPLGFDEEQVIVVELVGQAAEVVAEEAGVVRDALRRHSAVAGVAFASHVPGTRFGVETVSLADVPDHPGLPLRMATSVDAEYLSVLGVSLVAGRPFTPADSARAVVLNEAAAAALGLREPIGTQVLWNDEPLEVVGVARDFHYASLHEVVEPLAVRLRPERADDYLLVRAEAGQVPAALAALRAEWARFAPDALLSYSFLDHDFEQLYRAELRLGQVSAVFAGLAVLVACVGLFGLAAYAVQQRTKEVGVRKVLGASATHIVLLLSREFALLVLVGAALAAPIAYVAVHRWLEAFPHRIDVGPGVFLLAGAGVLLLALVTVASQALHAASTDPIKALRSE